MTLEGGIFIAVFGAYILEFMWLHLKVGRHWLRVILGGLALCGWLLMLNRGELWFLP